MEEKSTKRTKKRKRRLLPLMVFLAVSSVVCATALIYSILDRSENPLLTNQPDIELVNFVGMTEEQVKENQDFQYEIEYIFSGEYENGVVVSQKPTVPRTVKKNSVVKLKVSKGDMVSEMPDLVKQPRNKAEEVLSEYGVDIYIKMEEKKDFPEGLITRTEPEAGQAIRSGDVVTVYVAVDKIERNRVVPNVVGASLEEARRLISAAGLRVRAVMTVNEQPFGTVIWQNHGAGVVLPIGGEVEIHVSLGPQG